MISGVTRWIAAVSTVSTTSDVPPPWTYYVGLAPAVATIIAAMITGWFLLRNFRRKNPYDRLDILIKVRSAWTDEDGEERRSALDRSIARAVADIRALERDVAPVVPTAIEVEAYRQAAAEKSELGLAAFVGGLALFALVGGMIGGDADPDGGGGGGYAPMGIGALWGIAVYVALWVLFLIVGVILWFVELLKLWFRRPSAADPSAPESEARPFWWTGT